MPWASAKPGARYPSLSPVAKTGARNRIAPRSRAAMTTTISRSVRSGCRRIDLTPQPAARREYRLRRHHLRRGEGEAGGPAFERVRARLREGGRLTFAAFMAEALYGPEGYYARRPRLGGADADFFTSPELHPA